MCHPPLRYFYPMGPEIDFAVQAVRPPLNLAETSAAGFPFCRRLNPLAQKPSPLVDAAEGV
jgi:hypothetical protein